MTELEGLFKVHEDTEAGVLATGVIPARTISLASDTQALLVKDSLGTQIKFESGSKIPTSARGAASGVAPLDASTLVPVAYLPGSLPTFSTTASTAYGRGALNMTDSTAFRAYIGALDATLKGSAFGLAELDADGRVPAVQLPSYVDDVLEYASTAAFPVAGETGKIYVALDTNKVYRWGGSIYVVISDTLALGETSATAYRGDRGKVAYDHTLIVTGNPHGTTAADIGAASTSHAATHHFGGSDPLAGQSIAGLLTTDMPMFSGLDLYHPTGTPNLRRYKIYLGMDTMNFGGGDDAGNVSFAFRIVNQGSSTAGKVEFYGEVHPPALIAGAPVMYSTTGLASAPSIVLGGVTRISNAGGFVGTTLQLTSASASTLAYFDASKNLISATAGTDYLAPSAMSGTNGQVAQFTGANTVSSDVGLSILKSSGITRSLNIGNPAGTTQPAYLGLYASSGFAAAIAAYANNVERVTFGMATTAGRFFVRMTNGSGVTIDDPFTIDNASGGTIVLGGTTSRPVNITSKLQIAGVDRITAAGGFVGTSFQHAGATASTMAKFDGSKNLVSAVAGTDFLAPSAVSGAVNQVPYFTGSNSLGGSVNLTFDGSKTLSLGSSGSSASTNPRLNLVQYAGTPGGPEIFMNATGSVSDENSAKLILPGFRIIGTTQSLFKLQRNNGGVYTTTLEFASTNTADLAMKFAGPLTVNSAMLLTEAPGVPLSSAIYGGSVGTPGAANYSLWFAKSGADTWVNGTTGSYLAANNVVIAAATSAGLNVASGNLSVGGVTRISSAGAFTGTNGTFSGTVNFSGLTASRLMMTDASKNVVSSLATDDGTTFAYSGGRILANLHRSDAATGAAAVAGKWGASNWWGFAGDVNNQRVVHLDTVNAAGDRIGGGMLLHIVGGGIFADGYCTFGNLAGAGQRVALISSTGGLQVDKTVILWEDTAKTLTVPAGGWGSILNPVASARTIAANTWQVGMALEFEIEGIKTGAATTALEFFIGPSGTYTVPYYIPVSPTIPAGQNRFRSKVRLVCLSVGSSGSFKYSTETIWGDSTTSNVYTRSTASGYLDTIDTTVDRVIDFAAQSGVDIVGIHSSCKLRYP